MIDITTIAAWSPATEVQTRYGPRLMRRATPDDRFWLAWRTDRTTLRAAGIAVGKDRQGNWEVTWWAKVDDAEMARRAETRAASAATSADFDVPTPEGLALLPYQRAGVRYAIEHPRVLIADEMGLGKTVQAIGLLNSDKSLHRVVIVCPASLRLNWQRELERWLTRQASIHLLGSNGKDTWVERDGSELSVVVCNYDILHKHADALSATPIDCLVVDEAHYVKNSRTRRFAAVEPIAKAARRLLLLTGTPIPNRPVELLALIELLGPDVLERVGGSRWRYLRRYCDARQIHIGHGRMAWNFSGASHLPELHGILRETCMVRRRKADVLTELPPKRRQIIELPANGARAAIDAEAEAMAAQANHLTTLAAAVELAKASGSRDEYTAAVAALNDATRTAFTEISHLRRETALAKVPAVISIIEDSLGNGNSQDGEPQKVVVFAHHHEVIDAIADHFGPRAVRLDGRMNATARQASVDRFQTDPTCQLFVGSITAAGVGITLTASSHVIFAELDWVPGNVTQAEDRCHRIGQHASVLVQHIVLDGSIDAHLAKTLIAKQAVLDAALDDIERAEVARTAAIPTPRTASSSDTSFDALSRVAARVSQKHSALVLAAIRRLASVCDGAQTLDGHGFTAVDVRIGHALASMDALTPRQTAVGLRIAMRYRNTQLANIAAEIEAAHKEVFQ